MLIGDQLVSSKHANDSNKKKNIFIQSYVCDKCIKKFDETIVCFKVAIIGAVTLLPSKIPRKKRIQQ